MKTRKYQALPFNTNQRKRGGMSYALLLLLILLAPQIVKGQAPSPWSSTESYAPGSVVVDPHGVTYLAQQEVPAGTSLSNGSNWQSLDAIPPTVAPPTSVPSVTPNTGAKSSQHQSAATKSQSISKSDSYFKYLKLNPLHAGTSVDIDDLSITNLDDGQVEWTNNFNYSNGTDIRNKSTPSVELLTEFNFMDGQESWYYDSSLTRIYNQKLRLQTIGFRRNWPSGGGQASEGYNSESVLVYSALPKNFKIEFKATKLQYNGHFAITLQNSFSRDRPSHSDSTRLASRTATSRDLSKGTVIWKAHAWKQESPIVITDGLWKRQGEKTVPIKGENDYRITKMGNEISFHLNGLLFSEFLLDHTRVAPPTSVPSVTPNTGAVPNQLPNQTLEAGRVAQAQASSSKDHNQSDECCAGEDLHKEDHQKAGPRPNQPNGPGYVDYKLEWEKAKKDLVALNQRIAEEGERQRKQQEEIASLEKSILSKREETSRVQSDWDNCIAMGKKLLAELEGKRNSLAGLDARVTGLVSERKSIESEITACLLLVKESTEEFERLEQEHQPVVNKLAVPHLKGWHYEAEHGWLYVEIGSFPYVFSQRMDSWLYYKQGSHHPWQYFDYQRQAWNLWQ